MAVGRIQEVLLREGDHVEVPVDTAGLGINVVRFVLLFLPAMWLPVPAAAASLAH